MKFKPITPKKKLDVNAMLNRMRKLVKEQTGHSNKQFGLTYRTWEHQPEFVEDFEETSSQMIGSATTTDKGSTSNPYPFIARGTSVRYATMSDDFQPKSKPRVIGSSVGRGNVLYINKARPRPGIEAREYEQEIAKREQPKFSARGKKALGDVVKVSGHSI